MSLPVAFEQPWWLLLLVPALPLLYYLYRTSYSPQARVRELLALGLRVAVLVLLVLALAGAQRVRAVDELCVLFVVDWSDSMTEAGRKRALLFVNRSLKQMGPRDRAGVVVFAKEAYVEQAPKRGPWELGRIHTEMRRKTNFSDLASALRLALSSFPEDAQKRIVLVSDGNENLGDAAAQAILARTHGAEIVAAPIDNRPEQEVLIESFDLPGFVRKNEPFTAQVRLRAYHAGRGSLELYRNGEFVKKLPVEFQPGVRTISLEQRLEQEAFVTYEVSLVDVAQQDTIAENNTAQGYTKVIGRSRVLLVEGRREGEDDERGRFLVAALREGGIDVVLRGVGGVPVTRAELNRYDALILSDVPVMPDRYQQELVRDYVKLHGGGLVMIGGKDSFGMGGYWKTPIEEALPVRLDVRQKRYATSVALSIVIDSSGSMGMTVRGKTKLELACEGAIATLSLLGPEDQLEVILCDTEVERLVPMTRIGSEENRKRLAERLRHARLGGGGIWARKALDAGYHRLKPVQAMVKHMILFADGSDTEQKEGCERKIVNFREGAKITLSTIALGRGSDVPDLKRWAASGGGQFYLVTDAGHLPRIFTKDTLLIAKRAVVEGRIPPLLTKSVPMIEGIRWRSAPELLGYVVTSPRKRAELLLAARSKDRTSKADELDPLLARWRYGQGKALAFTSDAKNRWARHWLGWDGYKKLWAQSVRWTMRKEEHSEFAKRLVIRGSEGRIEVDAEDLQGKLYSGLDLDALVQPPRGGEPLRVKLKQTGAGRYAGKFQAFADGAYLVTIRMARERGGPALLGVIGGVRSYADEYRKLEPDRFLLGRLAQLSGGRLATAPERIFEHPPQEVRAARDVWRVLLAVGLLLFFLDILARRLVLPERVRGWSEQLVAAGRVTAPVAVASPPRAVRPVEPVGVAPRAIVVPSPLEPDEEQTYTSRLLAAKQRARQQQQRRQDEAGG